VLLIHDPLVGEKAQGKQAGDGREHGINADLKIMKPYGKYSASEKPKKYNVNDVFDEHHAIMGNIKHQA
jgi:hypothetical protein